VTSLDSTTKVQEVATCRNRSARGENDFNTLAMMIQGESSTYVKEDCGTRSHEDVSRIRATSRHLLPPTVIMFKKSGKKKHEIIRILRVVCGRSLDNDLDQKSRKDMGEENR